MSVGTADDWKALSALLDEMLEVPTGDRDVWVAALRERSPDIAARLDELLRDQSSLKDRHFMEGSARIGAIAGAEPGQTIGQYTLETLAGSGGMGSVWLARRSDGRFEGRVAIKFLHVEALGGPAARRFEMEGRLLATLAHPNIARLLDAGVTAAEQPYIVLEFIAGQPIDVYCDQYRLSVDGRVRLFLDVLVAVAHAHAHLVVHRDLKPSNILVTADGVVKLLDFGIAKLLQPQQPEAASATTREIGTALTPQFAAPEQLFGRPVTTATDVYALGLVLYMLLAGRHPRSDGDTTAAQWVKSITDEPPRPSDVVTDTRGTTAEGVEASAERRGASPQALRRTLRGDLDNILRKALKADPADRYSTVTELAADLRRYLRNEPVSARPDTLAYRAQKFVRRNRGGVAAGLLMVLALVIAIAVTAWQAVEARRQRDLALYQQQRAEASNEFMSILLGEVGPSGKALTLVELLDAGVKLLEQQYAGDPRFLGRMLYDMAHRYMDLGRQDTVIDLLSRAEVIARSISDEDLLIQVQCVAARERLVGEPEDARARMQEARTLAERHGGFDGLPLVTRVACLRSESKILEADSDFDGAVARLEEAQSVLETSPVQMVSLQLSVMTEIAELFYKSDRAAEALANNERVLEFAERSGRDGTMSHVIQMLNQSAILGRVGEVASAAKLQQEATARVQQLEVEGDAPIGMGLHYGGSLLRLGRREEALELFRKVAVESRAAGNVRWATTADYMAGRTLLRMGRFDEAVPLLDSAEKVWRANEGSNARMLKELELSRADILSRKGELEAARRAVDAILEDSGYPKQKTAPGLSSQLLMAARIHLAAGDAAGAEQLAADSLAIAVSIARDPKLSADVGQSKMMRAKARIARGNPAGARDDLEQAVESLTNGFGPDHEELREARALLGTLRT